MRLRFISQVEKCLNNSECLILYFIFSHLFLIYSILLYRLHTKCIESRVHSLFYFTFTRSILASAWAICMYIILYCFAWRTASLWTQKQVKSNKPVSVICFMFGHFLMFDWINLMHSAHNWLTIVVNLQFSVISNPKLLYLVLHLLIVDTMEALGCHKIGSIDIYFWVFDLLMRERESVKSEAKTKFLLKCKTGHFLGESTVVTTFGYRS